jgi:hypothetical protein
MNDDDYYRKLLIAFFTSEALIGVSIIVAALIIAVAINAN